MHFVLALLSHTIMLSSYQFNDVIFMVNNVIKVIGVAYSWNNSTAYNAVTS